jgi:putative methyltransferase (TIGR04325 family)
MGLKRFVRAVTPPFLVDATRTLRRRLRRSSTPEWEFVPDGWARAGAHTRGWDVDSVLDAYRTKLPAVRQAVIGPGPIGFATSAAWPMGEPTVSGQNTLLAFAYSLALASRHKNHVSVLDWGGGLGYFSLLSRAFLPDDVELEYHCKEAPLVCRYGREALPEITFWEDESCLAREYDFVVASSSLQYYERWTELLPRLAEASRNYLFLTRLPVVFECPSFVTLQRALGHRFESEFASWVFNRQEVIDTAAGPGMELVREFLLFGQPQIAGSPEQVQMRAYLFARA